MVEGFDRVREKLPGYRGPRIVAVPVLVLGAAGVGEAYLVAVESLPVAYPDAAAVVALEPLLPPAGTLTVLLAGFASLYQVWARRDRYRAENAATAYQRALLGAGLVLAAILNGYAPVYQVSRGALHRPLSVALATPLPEFLPGVERVGWVPRLALGMGVLGVGVVHAARTLQVLGVDTAMVVDLYYPDESTATTHAVYDVVRHPVYTGWLLWAAGGAAVRLSVYGLLDLCLFLAALVVWLRCVEEPELVDRFGDEYREYRREVPAFVPHPADLRRYVAFLLGGE